MPRKHALADEQHEQQQDQQQQPPAREPGDDTQERFPPQRGWKHDNAAGVERLYYSDTEKGIYEAWLKFRDGDPGDKVRTLLKENGYRWHNHAPSGGIWPDVKGAWSKPTNYQTLNQDRLNHERMFDKVAEMMCADKGIEAPQHAEGVPF